MPEAVLTLEPSHSTVTTRPLTIYLVGGIYGKDAEYRKKILNTPETTLEAQFKGRGHQVITLGHHERTDYAGADVIHVHHLGVAALAVAAQAGGAAFVYTSHDGPAMTGLADGVYRRAARRFVFSRADAVVALSAEEHSFQRKTYELNGTAHVVIPNGVDSSRFTYGRRNAAGNGAPWRLLCVGQLIASKGVEVLLRSLAGLSSNLELDLAYQTNALEAELKTLAGVLGIGRRVHFLGCQSPAELQRTYSAADMLILPSFAESLPSVVSEAMMCGTPVIATETGGVREQLGGYGLLVPAGNVGALALAIQEMITNYARFSCRSQEMSRYAGDRFSVETMATRHLELYQSLLGPTRSRRRNRILRRPLNAAARGVAEILCRK